MPRNRQLVRTLQMLRLLEAARSGRTIAELAVEWGVTERTIRRDLEALEEAGVPLLDEVSDSGRRWRALNRGAA